MKHHEHIHRVTYSETDQMGFAYYANYLVWFEIGRTELIRESGLTYRELEDKGFMLPVIEASCRYLKPARYDDLVTIRAAVTELKGVRMSFGYEVLLDGVLLAEGMTRHAFMDKNGRPVKPPAEIKSRME
ncbi:MAG TPA: thioesterase family protein [Nitrospirota bacterium]|jgi:acyl-CoA thioester hydrolase